MKLLILALLPLFQIQPPADEAEARQYYEKKNTERRQFWQQKQFDKAAALLEELVADPRVARIEELRLDAIYNLACAYALLGDKDKAMARLGDAERLGLWRWYAQVRMDTDFDSIRNTPEFQALLQRLRPMAIPVLQWASYRSRVLTDPPGQPQLVRLREEFGLNQAVAGAADEYETLRRIVKWSHSRWSHNGSNEPSRPDPITVLREATEGKQFRCVEYATIIAAAATALGMPARSLALKTADVETRPSGAGHVVAEVWLKQFNKWVYADGQWDVVPERNGVPLNAVELQEAIAREAKDLVCRTSSGTDPTRFVDWTVQYLYYFDFRLDQRHYASGKRDGRILMLVPKGVKPPTVFQRRFPIGDCTYISDPEIFYAPPGE